MTGLMPPGPLSYTGQVVVPYIRRTFNPTTSDFNFTVPTIWVNTATPEAFILISKPQNVANWIPFGGGSGDVQALEGDDGILVLPASNVIQLLGSVVANAANPKAIYVKSGGGNIEDIDVQLSAAIASTDVTKVGLAAFSSSAFTVDANGFVQLVGGGSPTESFTVDAFTAPGTSPVVPNGSGNITVTGGQVAAGTTTNVIRTDSLAANSYTIQIQRSQAVASTTIGDNGVCHFDSARFTVDANGFVSINGGAVGETITGNTGGALSPTSGNWNILGAAVAAGTTPVATAGSGSTLTANVQRSQAIASTNAANVGLAAFDSSVFTVDANGFVSMPNFSPFAYTTINAASSPYTVLSTDYYISCDSSAGAITIRLPNAPTTFRRLIIKDRTGSSSTNNISVTTVGGSVTIDGSTTYLINGNWASINLLFNGTSYEVF